MASAAPAPAVQANGDVHHLDPDTRRYADFYTQLLRLRDEVLAGKHPRFKLPDHALEKLLAQPHSRPSPTSRPALNGAPNGTAPHSYSHTSHSTSSYTSTPPNPFARPASSQRPPVLKPSSSGIDPVLLTKSDDLVRAEIQLKRQRIERVLKDQVDQKRVQAQARDRDFGVDTESRFDVSAVLTKALAIAPPVSGLRSETNTNSPTSDSFDENSYYSSQANSWSSSDHDASGTASAVEAAGKAAGVSAPVNGNSEADAQTLSQMELNDDMELVEDGDESDYEPPGAEAFTTIPPPPSHGRNPGANLSNTHGSLPSPTVPVITNHIQTPVAPRPARVSPLTFAKVPGLDAARGSGAQPPVASTNSSPRNGPRGKGNANRNENSPRSGRQSPTAPRQQNNSRKRRREAKEAEKAEKQRRVSNKRVADSPEPYIKEEPVSPPPLGSFVEPSQDARRRAPRTLHDDVEIVSPRDAPRPIYYMEYEQPAQAPRYEIEPEVVRVPSRVAYRRSERDDQDLRRVASIQYARRPYSPPQLSPYEPVRGVSHAYLEGHPTPVYREASVRPSAATRYIRSERSISPPYALDPYQGIRSPALMAPPPAPRRVVMDQYGNKYYAEPAPVDRRASAAPPPRRVGEEALYERARTREPTMRPVARVEPYDEEEALQRMPPPQPRRYMEQPELEIVDPHRSYRQREYSMRPAEPLRDELVPAQEPLERHLAARYEDMPPPPRGEYITRAYSVRPEGARRELPVEYMARHGSVAPGGGYTRRVEPLPLGYREVSVVHGGDGFEERRYAYAPQHSARRYVDEQDVIERPAEAQEYGGEPRNIGYRY